MCTDLSFFIIEIEARKCRNYIFEISNIVNPTNLRSYHTLFRF